MSENIDYDSLSNKELTKLVTEKMGIVKALVKEIRESHFVLEVKFDGQLPVWVRQIIRDFNLHVQAISKYCRGLDNWQTNVAELESII